MPAYDFVCDSCGSDRTIICSMSDRPEEVTCQQCCGVMRRDYRSEGAISTFHPTVDIAAKEVRRLRNKNKNKTHEDRV